MRPALSTEDKILNHLRKLARNDEAPETAAEIGLAINATTSCVSTNLRRMADEGKVRRAGEAMSGGKTWTLTKEQQ